MKIRVTAPAMKAKRGITVPVGAIMAWEKKMQELCKKHPELRARLATYERVLH